MTLYYPPQDAELQDTPYYGAVPVDFIMENILLEGLQWFRTDVEAKNFVFGWLLTPTLAKYGQAKIDAIAAYINKYEIAVVQGFSLIDNMNPSISIVLGDAGEMLERAGLNDFQRQVDILNQDATEILTRYEDGYSAMTDAMHIGIHTINTPDLAKYIYYLVIYILNVRKTELEAAGLILGTYRATDLSRMNDYLPENMYSRFINFTISSMMRFRKGSVPMVDTIRGVHAPGPDIDPNSDIENIDLGLKVSDIKQSF